MKPTLKVLKKVVFYASALSFLGYGLYAYEQALRELLPKDLEQRSAQDRKVPPHSSLLAGEELVYDNPSPRRLMQQHNSQEGNLVVSLTAGVSSEYGASAVIAAREGVCPPGVSVYSSDAKIRVSQQLEEALNTRLSRTICVPITAGVPFEVRSLQGTWSAAAALPEMESAVQVLDFTAPDGSFRSLRLAAVGYCDSEEGDCSATAGFEHSPRDVVPETSLYLVGEGSVTLKFNADAE